MALGAANPTYPAAPIASVLACITLIMVLLSSFIRQSWNLGVAFLCGWLLLGNFIVAVDTIVWSDNADIKLYVYCDISEYVQDPEYGMS